MSRRLQNAACAEIARIEKRRTRLAERMARINERIAPILAEYDALNERIDLIASAAGITRPAPIDVTRLPRVRGGVRDGIVVSGRQIRIQAVRSMMERHGLGHAAHYAQWYAAFSEDGYAIRSSDPVATFLTQLGRSPWVRHSSQKGVYALADEDVVAVLDDQAQLAYAAVHDTLDSDEQLLLLKKARAYARRRDEAVASSAFAAQAPCDVTAYPRDNPEAAR